MNNHNLLLEANRVNPNDPCLITAIDWLHALIAMIETERSRMDDCMRQGRFEQAFMIADNLDERLNPIRQKLSQLRQGEIQ